MYESKLLVNVILTSLLMQLTSSTGVDLGNCGCACGIGGGGAVIGSSSATSEASFLNNVRGPKGNVGRPGKAGPPGLQGPPGLRGPVGEPGFGGASSAGGALDASCFDLRASGRIASGIYSIKPNPTSATIEVYCDMTTAGGGWTLVASVHENNINGKCTIGDNWSSDQGMQNSTGGENWSNFNVFGSVEGATSGDYKSPAYFNLLGSDVMIWHVPNNVDSEQWSDSAILKYYTNNRFLDNYGGTLQSLYSKYFPLVLSRQNVRAYEGVVSILQALSNAAADIRSTIPQFYLYTYDHSGSIQNSIGDGGGDMYDTGNKVSYKIGSNSFRRITYREKYEDLVNGIEISSVTSHPFIMLMWIGNHPRSISTFQIKVESGTGADGSGRYTTYSGDITYQNLRASYKAYSIWDANDPSICEVYFHISNPTQWGSTAPTSFTTPTWSSATDNIANTAAIGGSPESILFGYTLLSRDDDFQVTDSHVRAALTRMMQEINNFQEVENFNCSRLNESLTVPVQYDIGSNDVVTSHTPPSVRDQAVPGFIHFRPYDPKGVPNALCPGVRSDSCRPSSICVGGINTNPGNSRTCGDFAGWDGLDTDRPTAEEPAGFAKSLNDVASSLLLFTRKRVS